MLEEKWASPEDFATLFQYFWHRDFPMDQRSTGARRSDWTIHTGIVVRNIADLMGFMARFESGKRKDAVLRNKEQDVIALEWEWEGARGNEIKKLKEHRLWSYDNDSQRKLQYAVFITYTTTEDIDKVYEDVSQKWGDTSWPLLLVLIDVKESKEFFSGREFRSIKMSKFYKGKHTDLRSALALPWKVPKTRWFRELK
jgi:hypothetical protein